MLKKIEVANNEITAFEVTQKLTKEDYTKTLEPLARSAKIAKRKLKLLLQFGEEFKGFTSAAAIEDFKLGAQNATTFERIAIVSDNKWITNSSAFIGSLIPSSLKTYNNKSLTSAINWLAKGNKGVNHRIDSEKGILIAKVKSSLSSDQFTAMAQEVDEWTAKNGPLKGIVIQARKFPGWRDVGSFISHFQFVKNHHKKFNRLSMGVCHPIFCLFKLIKLKMPHFSFYKVTCHFGNQLS